MDAVVIVAFFGLWALSMLLFWGFFGDIAVQLRNLNGTIRDFNWYEKQYKNSQEAYTELFKEHQDTLRLIQVKCSKKVKK